VIRPLALAVCTSVAACSAMAADQPFSFDWHIYGPDKAMPTQVFSDGKEIRMEFPAAIKPTKIYSIKDGDKTPIHLRRAAPYYVAETDSARIEVVTNKGRVTLENAKQASLMAEAQKLKDEMAALRKSVEAGTTIAGIAGEEAAVVSSWRLKNGESLRGSMERWVSEAGWQHLNWTLPYDYPIEADAEFMGELPEAVRQVEEAYRSHGGLKDAAVSASIPNRVISFEVRTHAQQ